MITLVEIKSLILDHNAIISLYKLLAKTTSQNLFSKKHLFK